MLPKGTPIVKYLLYEKVQETAGEREIYFDMW